MRCARHADRYRTDERPTPALATAATGPAAAHEAVDVAAIIDSTAVHRVDPTRGHAWRPLMVPSQLVWRAWFMDNNGPYLALPTQHATPVALRMMYGLHVGVHLDHLAALVSEGRADVAQRLQFGRGLLVAESVAMLAELLHLAGIPAQPDPHVRRFLHTAVVDRLARLPAVREWGPAAAPGSPTMAAAAEHPNVEFRTLPTLAAAYVHGPVQLAEAGLEDEFLPNSLRCSLRHALCDPRLERLVASEAIQVR